MTAKKVSLIALALFINFVAYMMFFYTLKPVENIVCHQVETSFDGTELSIVNESLASFTNIKYPSEIENALMLALSFFPELKNIDIEISYASISTTMNCRPLIGSLFTTKRIYQMQINNHENFDGILMEDVPFNALVGILGHELAHIVDYEAGGILRVIKRGLDYALPSTKTKFEHEIDMLTIQKGLGWQVMDFADFAMNRSVKATDEYKKFKKEIYMSPVQMKDLFEEIECY
jgi:hypothetical protein